MTKFMVVKMGLVIFIIVLECKLMTLPPLIYMQIHFQSGFLLDIAKENFIGALQKKGF